MLQLVALLILIGLVAFFNLREWLSGPSPEVREVMGQDEVWRQQMQDYDDAVEKVRADLSMMATARAALSEEKMIEATETLEIAVFDAMGNDILPMKIPSRVPTDGEMILLGLYRLSRKKGRSFPRTEELDSALRSAYRDYDPERCEWYVRYALLRDTTFVPWSQRNMTKGTVQ